MTSIPKVISHNSSSWATNQQTIQEGKRHDASIDNLKEKEIDRIVQVLSWANIHWKQSRPTAETGGTVISFVRT